MNIKGIEKNLKSSLKSKARITLALIVGFMITGNILANDIDWHGKANGHGNPINMNIPNKEEIKGIDIGLEGIVDGYWSDTTSALILNNNHTLTRDIKVMADGIDNNDGLFARSGANLKIEGDNIYIASIGKNKNFGMAKGAMYASYFLGTELDTLSKHMGELNYLEDNNEGMWVRYRHNRTEWEDTFKTDSNMVQLGYSKKLKEKHQIGMSVDYTDADTSIHGVLGEGKNERYSINLYDTWVNENGHYYDLVIRGGRINNDYDTKGIFTNGIYDIGSKYHQYFGNVSGEYGFKYELENGWYLKPQTQLQLSYIEDVNYTSKSGIKVEENDMTSFIGRLGFNLGREIGRNNYYIKADLLHEFLGDKEFALTGSDGQLNKEFVERETWINLGIGTKMDISESTSLWADIECSFRSNFENTWQANIEFSYKF